jgi:AcrR family transcriptional regulator
MVSNTVSDMASRSPLAVGTEHGRAATMVGVREVPGDMVAKLEAAADELLARFDELQMADIAAAAGIARSSLYYYFANKDDVLSFFLRSTLQALTEATGPVVAAPGDPRTRLRAVIRAQLQHLNDHPSASQLLIANLGRVGKLPDIAASVAAGFEEPVRRLLAEGTSDGSFRRLPDEEMAATALFGAALVVGLRTLVVEGTIDVDRVTDVVEAVFWDGIVAPATATSAAPQRRSGSANRSRSTTT